MSNYIDIKQSDVMSNYIDIKQSDVITHPIPNFYGDLRNQRWS